MTGQELLQELIKSGTGRGKLAPGFAVIGENAAASGKDVYAALEAAKAPPRTLEKARQAMAGADIVPADPFKKAAEQREYEDRCIAAGTPIGPMPRPQADAAKPDSPARAEDAPEPATKKRQRPSRAKPKPDDAAKAQPEQSDAGD